MYLDETPSEILMTVFLLFFCHESEFQFVIYKISTVKRDFTNICMFKVSFVVILKKELNYFY